MITDYSTYPTVNAEPVVANMIESFRAVGYTIESAVADIMDNSISAGAKNIWLDFNWAGERTVFSIKDDGCGMTDAELINAMRPGSKDPKAKRDGKDLGRFGLGLKTASFSQCKKYTVISRKEAETAASWTWDLDYVYYHAKKWQLISITPPGNWQEQIEQLHSGTIVIWWDMDHLLKGTHADDGKAQDKFLQVMERVKLHIASVFHRYIEGNKLKIFFCGREVIAWNPFMIAHNATQSFPEEPLHNGVIKMRGFVLPHKSKLTNEEFRRAEGEKGWSPLQGFYVYRNERMLVGGDWLGMFRKEEPYKLARIMIDLPNHLDTEWQIDIKKSVARIPGFLKDNIKAYASAVRSAAIEVYRHRGKIIQAKTSAENFQPVWIERQKDNRRFYEINRKHPLIESMDQTALTPLLRLLEETLPVPSIVINESEHPDSFFRPFEKAADGELKKLMLIVYNTLLNNNTPEQAKSRLFLTAPFNEYPELIACL